MKSQVSLMSSRCPEKVSWTLPWVWLLLVVVHTLQWSRYVLAVGNDGFISGPMQEEVSSRTDTRFVAQVVMAILEVFDAAYVHTRWPKLR